MLLTFIFQALFLRSLVSIRLHFLVLTVDDEFDKSRERRKKIVWFVESQVDVRNGNKEC